MSYALALLVELYRAARVDGSRLMQLAPDSRAADLLALANAEEVTDLIAMRDLVVEQLLSSSARARGYRPAGPFLGWP
ncbi:hypothetical protein [Micromonospora zamorensis]|uniref:hypothetical protein n=1 Tax=Micromonospora zamorensis TaxID=709883 RepID=UPI0033E56113